MTLKEDLLEQDEFWILLFIMGTALLNWPFLSMASRDALVLGYPLVLVYITIIWLAIVLSAYIFDRWASD